MNRSFWKRMEEAEKRMIKAVAPSLKDEPKPNKK
jgi:hypothetical protein